MCTVVKARGWLQVMRKPQKECVQGGRELVPSQAITGKAFTHPSLLRCLHYAVRDGQRPNGALLTLQAMAATPAPCPGSCCAWHQCRTDGRCHAAQAEVLMHVVQTVRVCHLTGGERHAGQQMVEAWLVQDWCGGGCLR